MPVIYCSLAICRCCITVLRMLPTCWLVPALGCLCCEHCNTACLLADPVFDVSAEGCHAYDVGTPYPEDPPSVTAARNQGAALIGQWVKQYNTVKTQIPLSNAANMFDVSYSLGGYTQVVNDTLTGSTLFRNQQVLNVSASYSNSLAAMA